MYCIKSIKINIEGLSSLRCLHLRLNSSEIHFSIRNLSSLLILSLMISCTIDENILSKLLENVQYIEQLFLTGNYSYFKLDSLYNLKLLSLAGTITESFNFELFKNLCNQLVVFKADLTNIEEKKLYKLFDGHTFPNLEKIAIRKCNLKRLKKEFLDRFPILRKLFIIKCNLKVIERKAFSNLSRLYCLDLSENMLQGIKKDTFSYLKNLEVLDLSNNQLKNLNAEFVGVRNTVKIFLENKEYETFCCQMYE